MGINSLSRKKTSSSNSSCEKALLSSKKRKRKITEIKKVAMLIKQIKSKTRIMTAVTSTRQIILLSL